MAKGQTEISVETVSQVAAVAAEKIRCAKRPQFSVWNPEQTENKEIVYARTVLRARSQTLQKLALHGMLPLPRSRTTLLTARVIKEVLHVRGPTFGESPQHGLRTQSAHRRWNSTLVNPHQHTPHYQKYRNIAAESRGKRGLGRSTQAPLPTGRSPPRRLHRN